MDDLHSKTSEMNQHHTGVISNVRSMSFLSETHKEPIHVLYHLEQLSFLYVRTRIP